MLLPAGSDGVVPPPVILLGKAHSPSGEQFMKLVFPLGKFDVQVVVTDKWDAFTVHKAAVNFEVNLP